MTRISIVCIGLFLPVWGIWYELPDSVWTYMAVTGTIYLSGAGVVLLGGIYWDKGSSTGALAALLAGLIAVAGLFLDPLNNALGTMFNTEFAVTGHQIGFFNFIFCALVFVGVSLAFPDHKAAKEERA